MNKTGIRFIEGLLLVILLSSCSPNKNTIEYNLAGAWQYEQISVTGTISAASALNECGYKEIIVLSNFSKRRETKVFNSQKVELYPIGKSSKIICMLNPESLDYDLVSNSCPTEWYKDVQRNEQVYAISEGRINKYELSIITKDSIVLTGILFQEYATEAKTLDHTIQLKRKTKN